MPFSKLLQKLKKPEAREQYRVANKDAQVILHLVGSDDSLLEVDLVDSSAGGLRFRFREEAWPVTEGTELVARLRARDSSQHVETTVEARHIHRKEGEPEAVGCRFVDPKGFFDEADPSLWRVFNRRASFRVPPPAGDPVEVEIVVGDDTVAATLVDISAGGIGLLAPPGALQDEAEVEVGIPLPEVALPLRLRAAVRWRHEADDRDRVGLEFVLGEDEESPDEITDYVMLRQREINQSKAK